MVTPNNVVGPLMIDQVSGPNDHPSKQVAVASDVFVQPPQQIRTQLQWSLKIRESEGVVPY